MLNNETAEHVSEELGC